MPGRALPPGPRRQRGIALLAFLLIVFLAGTSLLLQQLNRTYSPTARQARVAETLLQAKEALTASAVVDSNRPGSLPCPDIAGDGVAPSPVIYQNHECPDYVGRLPWRTLDLPDLRDGSGERLWYVLAPALRDAAKAEPINNLSPSMLTLDGAGGVAALIIAPGAALTGQNRPGSRPSDYLDGDNGDGDNRYISAAKDNAFNDRIVALSTAALFSAVAPRILGELRAALACAVGQGLDADSDGDGRSNAGISAGGFPFAEPACATLIPAVVQNNQWHPLVSYDRAARTLGLNGHRISLP